MSFLARLELDGEPLTVLHCGFRFSQATDVTGKPTAIPQGGTISLTVESDADTHLFDWMINPTQTKSGTITFFRRDASSKLKTIEFIDAHCVDYYETYDHLGEHPMQIQMVLSAHEVKMNDSEFKNNWPV